MAGLVAAAGAMVLGSSACRDRIEGPTPEGSAATLDTAVERVALVLGQSPAVNGQGFTLGARRPGQPSGRSGWQAPAAYGGGPIAPPSDAHQRYAAAVCERAASCGELGSGRRYADRGACEQAAREERGDDWSTVRCVLGFNAAALDHCVATVRHDACGELGSALARQGACQADVVCAP